MENAHVRERNKNLPPRPLLSEVKPLYFTKEGYPKKEFMASVYQWFERLDKALEPLTGDPMKRHYQLGYANSVKSTFVDWCIANHISICQWRDESTGIVYIGFTQDPDKYVEGARQLEQQRDQYNQRKGLQITSQDQAARQLRRLSKPA